MQISLLQWNVWYKEDPDKIIQLIKELNPDVICAQEFIQHSKLQPPLDTAKYIADKLSYKYFFQVSESWTNRPEKETQGNAIFSKLPIVNKRFEYIQPPKTNPVNAAEEGRVYVELTVEKEGKRIIFSTTHLSYTPFFEMTEQRKNEANNLLEILKKKKQSFIFTGDLNAAPDSFLINSINNLNYLKHLGPDFSEKTWTTKPFDKDGFAENELNWRLDYIFGTKNIVVEEIKIIETDVSDHLPIFARLVI